MNLEIIKDSIQKKLLGKSEKMAGSPEPEIKPDFLKILNEFAKSMISLPGLAKDLNIAKRNLGALIKLKGGKPANKADMFFLKADEREAKFEVDMANQISKDEASKTPTTEKAEEPQDPLQKIMTSLLGVFGLGALGKYFSISKILKSLKIIGITFLITTIASGIYQAYKEFTKTGDILASVKAGFVEFVDFVTMGIFGKENIGKLFDDVINFLVPIAETVGNFIDGIGKFFSKKFEQLKRFFGLKEEKQSEPKTEEARKSYIETLNEDINFLKEKRDSLNSIVEKKSEKLKTLQEEERRKRIEEAKASAQKVKDAVKNVASKVLNFISPPTKTEAPAPAPSAAPAATPTSAAPAATPTSAATPEPSKIITPSTGSTKSLSQLVSIQSDTTIDGLNQTLVDRMTAMAEAFKEQTGKKIFVTSGYRSNEEQKELYDRWVQGGKKDKIVSKPKAPLKGIDGLSGAGSPHSSGVAIDVNSKGDGGINVLAGPADKSTGWLEKFGLTRPVYPPDFTINGKPIDKSKQEDWHIVAIGSKPGSPDGGIIPSSSGSAIDPSTGKKSGKQLAADSTEVATNKREQEKRQTPTVINAGTTNNNTHVVNKHRVETQPA